MKNDVNGELGSLVGLEHVDQFVAEIPVYSQKSLSVSAMIPQSARGVLVVAHRGVWNVAPENSLSAIEAAIHAGADIVEIDVRRSADGVFFVIHDDTLDRTTDLLGSVEMSSSATMRRARLRAGAGGPAASMTTETLLTLAELLESVRGRIALNLDTKTPEDAEDVANLVLDLRVADQVVLKTTVYPEDDPLQPMRLSFFGKVPYMPIMTARPGRFVDDLRAMTPLQSRMIELKADSLDVLVEGADELARQDMRVWINTLDLGAFAGLMDTNALADPTAVWGTAIAAGVGAIQTDQCASLRSYLRQSETR
jgi:glycerophosphoryl diester phosphodiesterase